MRHRRKARSVGYLSVLLVGFLATGAVADQHGSQPAEEPIQLQELVVVGVGTRGQGRTVTDSPVPVDVVTEQEILETGEAELGRVIQALIPSFNFSSSTISDGTDSVRPATLRGMGPDQVLVLLNGKRRHGSALIHVNTSVGRGTAGTDLNAIPVSAIKRIEVLRDGASAQYGSDAIAGVINIVLKDSYDGALHVSSGQTYESDGTRFTARLNKGFQIGEEGVLHAALEISHRDPTNRAGLSGARQYGTGDDPIDYDLERAFNRRNFRIGDAELDQFSGALNYSNTIDALGSEIYAFGDLTQVENESGGFYRRANQLDRNPLTSVYPDGFLPLIHTTVSDFSIGAGVVREFENNLRADASVVHGGNSFNFEVTNSHNASWVALNCMSRETCAAQTSADAGTLSLDLTTVNVDFSWPWRENVHLAWGLEYRLDRYRIEAGEEYSYLDYDGPGTGGSGGIQVFPGFKPSNEVNETRNAFSLYLDTEIFVSDTLLVSPAVRLENYSDFGSTVNGKVATKLDLSAEFALRGSVSTGFRAPSMQQLYFNNISTQFRDVEGQQIAFEVGTFRNDSDLAKAIGIPGLDAETSLTGSVGFVYQPLPEFTLTTDFYLIDVSDRIIISNQIDADTPGIPASVQAAIIAAGGDRGQFFMNAADTRTQGVDVVATWDVPLVMTGDLGLKLLATVSETEITAVNLPADLPEALFGEQDRSIVEEWQPSYRLTLSGTYGLDRFSAALAVHGYGPYTVLDGERQTYDARYLTDVRLGYRLAFGRLSVGANNLFNVTPEKNEIGQSRGGTIIAPDGTVIVDSPGVFTYSRRSAPFGFNGGFYFVAYDVEF